ncbi:MAG: riboflavin synthase [Eubacteriales bacterium]|nr:riboflavin synthase [Eubacteriales bacterium]
MFTGIIEETGTIRGISSHGGYGEIRIACRTVLGKTIPDEVPTKTGDSISVNGICLTVTKILPDGFTADVMPETVRRSALHCLSTGSRVNLERAMPMNGRFGGHIVSGHIDGTGSILSMKEEGNAVLLRIGIPDTMAPYIVEKGSITIDGISLTVAAINTAPSSFDFTVSIIPHTLSETSLSERKTGDLVNLETDLIGKYVEHLLRYGPMPDENAHSFESSDPQKERDRRLEALLRNF